jgi:hypothetical protein
LRRNPTSPRKRGEVSYRSAPIQLKAISDFPVTRFAPQPFSDHARNFHPLSALCSMTQPDIWYVAFGRDRAVKTDASAAGRLRSTRTFKSEVDAKLFAMQVLAKGL